MEVNKYLVDTDVMIDHLRNLLGATDYLESLGAWSYSVVTAMELFTGAANQRDVRKLEKLLTDYNEVALSAEIGAKGRQLVRTYAKSGGVLPLDALIAATAITEKFTLVSRNRKHFQNIDGLSLEVPDYS